MAAVEDFKGIYNKNWFFLPPNPQVAPGSILLKGKSSFSYLDSILSLVRGLVSDEDVAYLEERLSNPTVEGTGSGELTIELGSKFSAWLSACVLQPAGVADRSSSYHLELNDSQMRSLREPLIILSKLSNHSINSSVLGLLKTSEVILVTSVIESQRIEVVSGRRFMHRGEVAATLPAGTVAPVPISASGGAEVSSTARVIHSWTADENRKLPSLIKGYKLVFKNGRLTRSTPVGFDKASTSHEQNTQQPSEAEAKAEAAVDAGTELTDEEREVYELLYGENMSAFPQWAEDLNSAAAAP